MKHSPVSIITKGTLVVRDRDLLAELSMRAGCTVCFSITTMDVTLWRRMEPGTPPPLKRLQAMESLVRAGVNAGVLLAPVMPGITDGGENLKAVVRAAADHGARFLGASTLYLKEGTKDHFLSFIEKEYPHLSESYRRLYPGAFAPWGLKNGLQSQVASLKRLYRLDDRSEVAQLPQRPGQLQMALTAE